MDRLFGFVVWTVGAFAVAVAVLMLAFAVFGPDDRECLRSHLMQTVTIVPAGKVMVPIVRMVPVCDEYAEVAS